MPLIPESIFAAKHASKAGTLLLVALFGSVTAAWAADAREFEFAIPVQPMPEALVAFSRVSRLQVAADGVTLEGLRSNAVQGTLTAAAALETMIGGKGIVIARLETGDFILRGDALPAPDRPPTEIETIVVRGTKQGLTLQDTKESVTVFTSESINEQALFRLEDALLRAPNVTVGQDLSNISVRGITAGGVGNVGTGRTLNVYQDGAPIGFFGTTGAFNLWDVDQIEILRGPQSTTQGRNALAGAIALQTADPEHQFDAAARVILADNKIRQYSAMVNAPVVDEQVALRVAVDYREEDWERFYVPIQESGGIVDELTARGKLLIEPEAVEDLRIELTVQHVDVENRGSATFFSFPPPDSEEFETFDPFSGLVFSSDINGVDLETTRTIAEVDWGLGENWRVYVNAAQENTERRLQAALIDTRSDEEVEQVDLRFHFDFGRTRGWLGAYYYDESTPNTETLFFQGQAFPFLFIDGKGTGITNRFAEVANAALYGEISRDVTERLTLAVGARYDQEETKSGVIDFSFSASDGCLATFFVTVLPCELLAGQLRPASGQLDADYEAFLPRASAEYTFDNGDSVAFQVARGYRAGGVVTVGPELDEFDPEFLINYELSYRSTWLDDRLLVNANAFYSDWEDQQINVPTEVPGVARPANAGASELYGLELATRYRVNERLEVYFSLGLLETEFTNFPFGIDNAGNPLPVVDIRTSPPTALTGDERFVNLAGNEFPSAPGVTASVGGSYRGPRGLFASVNVSYTGGRTNDLNNLRENRTDSFTLVNGRMGWEWRKWRASVFVENLLDDEFFTSLSTAGVAAAAGQVSLTPGLQQGTFSRPRNVGAQIEYAF